MGNRWFESDVVEFSLFLLFIAYIVECSGCGIINQLGG